MGRSWGRRSPPSASQERSDGLRPTVGRNVALFNLTRQWAYRARLRYTDFTEWSETVYAFASMKNASVIADEFSRGPMGEGEVAQIAKSIASWVWTRITPEQTEANRKRWAENLKKGRTARKNSLIEELRKIDDGR